MARHNGMVRTAVAGAILAATVGVGGVASAAPAVQASAEFDGTMTCGTTVTPVHVMFRNGRPPQLFGVDGTVFVAQSTTDLLLTFYLPDGSVEDTVTLPGHVGPGATSTMRGGANGGVACHWEAVSTDVWSTDGSRLVASMDVVVAVVGKR